MNAQDSGAAPAGGQLPRQEVLSAELVPSEQAQVKVTLQFAPKLASDMGAAIRGGMDPLQAVAIFLTNVRVTGFQAVVGVAPKQQEAPQIAVARAMPPLPPGANRIPRNGV